MNKYIGKKEKKWKKKSSKIQTDQIEVKELDENSSHDEINLDDFKKSEPTYSETLDKNPELAHQYDYNFVPKNPSLDGELNTKRSVFNDSQSIQSNEYDKSINTSVNSNWDRLKLMKLKQKIIEASYVSDSFITYIENNYNILDLSLLFKEKQSFSDILKLLIQSHSPIAIKSSDKDDLNSGIRRLYGLMQSSKADLGTSTLKMGWPFACGLIQENKNQINEASLENQNANPQYSINTNTLDTNQKSNSLPFYGPLLLWPVILQTRDRKIFNMHLARKHGQLEVEVNSHLLLSLTHANNFFENSENLKIKTDAFVKVLYSEDTTIFTNNIVEKYTSFGFKFSSEAISEIKRIIESFDVKNIRTIPKNDFTRSELEKSFGQLNENEIKILPYSSIGTYPIANVSLYIDYVKMLHTDGAGFVNKIDNTFYSQLELAEEYHKYFSETSLREIVKLDFSQKKACNVALNDNLVISGAAGNGKSQTISSIIANAVNNLKSVLFSTEKKEAANVIFNRLGRLRNYSLKLFESDNFAKDVTSQLKNGLERISLVYGIKDSISSSNTNVVSEKLDSIYKRVNDFKSVMMSEDGQNYPEYIFKKNKMKQTLKEVIQLVGPILKHSESSSDFWVKINQINDDYLEFNQLSKVRETLNFSDELFSHAFNIVKYYDGNNLFYDNYLIQYARAKRVNEAFESLPEEKVREFLADRESVNLENYATDSKALYWSLYSLFHSIDDYSVDIMKSHNLEWYTKTASLVKQKSTELVVEFRQKYSPDEFDFEFFHDYYLMEKFAADNGDSFQIDNENYYEMIDNLITNKLGEDIRTTEFLFALKVTSILKEDKELAKSFNKLYALIKNTEVVNSVEDVLINYSNIISLIFPLILGSPSMIAKFVVCESGIFDICIIDEASMIPLENAFPLLYRSHRWIVSGDLKQLPPVTYQKNIEKYNKYHLMQIQNSVKSSQSEDLMKYKAFETPISLLEYIGTKIQTVVLEYHYRSVKKELFEFSNVVFYRNMIHVADDQNEQAPNIVTGINLKTIDGICENGINKKEAHEIVKIVEQIVSQPNHGTIGIITTTNEQRDYIENLLLEHPSKLVTNEFSRISEDGEDNSLFVLTCEKVQGSERDNIIISFVASKGTNNNILAVNRTLGVLGTEVGPNFLNVLITRSRLALFLINSFSTEEIIVDNNLSLSILKDYLEYAKLLTTNGHDLNDPRVQAIFKPYIKNNAMLDFSNDMKGRAISRIAPDLKEDLLQVFAFEPRLEIVDGWYEGSVKIDIVIRDRKTKRNIIGILCDEFIYDVMVNGKQRDFYNRKFLETRNWHFFALSSLQWSKVYKRQSIIDKIINMLTINLANWTDALRISKLKKYSIDENGNVIIVDDVIKNASNRLDVIEVDAPLIYEGDKELYTMINKNETIVKKPEVNKSKKSSPKVKKEKKEIKKVLVKKSSKSKKSSRGKK